MRQQQQDEQLRSLDMAFKSALASYQEQKEIEKKAAVAATVARCGDCRVGHT